MITPQLRCVAEVLQAMMQLPKLLVLLWAYLPALGQNEMDFIYFMV